AKIKMQMRKELELNAWLIMLIIVWTSILRRAKSQHAWEVRKVRCGEASHRAGYTDGAKIYICYRRCCFLTWQGRSSFLHRLSPRKSRLQSQHSKMRSLSERRSRHDEAVSAR